MKKAVIYARFSSHGQTEQSIEGQLRVCNEYAKKNDFIICDTYIDRKKTAQNDNRPNFQQMLLDSNKKQWDFVIVYALDRFARDDGDYGADKRLLRNNGVKLLSATEVIGTNADGSENLSGILTEGILVAYAKFYSRELSKKVKRGQYESLQKGNFLGGKVLYGYCVDNNKLTIEPDEAEVIKSIFNMYAEGRTADGIVAELKTREIRNKSGRYFCKNSIMNILKNKRYTGFYKYGIYEFENYNPGIITEQLFNICSEKLTRKKRDVTKFENYGNYLLSGKLYCGNCLTLMYGESGTSKTKKTYYYYKCFNKKKKLGCEKKNISQEFLEDLVFDITINSLLKEDTLIDLVENVVKVHNAEIKKNAQISLLTQQLSETESFINNLLDAIKHGIFTASTKTELERLEQEKADTISAIEKLKAKLPTPITEEQVLMFFQQFAKDKECTSKRDRNKIIGLLIEAIVLFDKKIVVIFKNGDNSAEKIDIKKVLSQLDASSSKKNHLAERLSLFSNARIIQMLLTSHYIAIECLFNP